MNVFKPVSVLACLLLAAGGVAAQGAIGNGVPQPRVGPAKKLTAQECTDRAAAADKKKDAASARQDRYCTKLLKKAAAASAPGK